MNVLTGFVLFVIWAICIYALQRNKNKGKKIVVTEADNCIVLSIGKLSRSDKLIKLTSMKGTSSTSDVTFENSKTVTYSLANTELSNIFLGAMLSSKIVYVTSEVIQFLENQ